MPSRNDSWSGPAGGHAQAHNSVNVMRIAFDSFELDLDRRELLRGGEPIHLSPKAFLLLELLVDAAPRALSKQEINDAIWPDTYVEECNLAGLIVELRGALGDPARQPRFIRTLHGFGYSFCADVARPASRECRGFVVFDGREFPLYEGTNIIGRESAAGVRIDDATVSRRHANLEVRGDRVVLSDLGSKNGTYVNGMRIDSSVSLSPGQAFVVGVVQLAFSLGVPTQSTLTLQHA